MPTAPELRTVAERTRALALLRRHADLGACDVAVFDAEGASVAASGALASARPYVNGAGLRVEGAAQASAAAVQVFDRLVGYVVAAPRPEGGGEPADVAARGAALLSDLCTREYELNDLSREILGAYEELNLFYDLSAEFAGAADPEAVGRVVARKAAGVLGAERAWVLLADPVSGALRVLAAHEPPEGPSDVAPGRGAAGRVVAARQAEVLDDCSQAAEGALAGWERCARRALLTAPLCVAEREDRPVLGVLQVVGRADGRAFTSGELKLACALASHAAVLVENQRLITYERELRLARTIQQGLLPETAPQVEGLDVAGRCVPALSVGGDYFDHFVTGSGLLGVVLADVSGHDLAAALLQTTARATIRAQVIAGDAPAQVLDGANRALIGDLSRADMFLTAWFGTVDPATGRLRHADAGHVPALVYRAATRTVEEVATGGVPIGVLPDGGYEQGETLLAPGDVLVAYTDGLTEARAPGTAEEYGPGRLQSALAAAARLPAAEIVDALLADVSRFDGGGAAPDDRSLVVVKMRDRASR